MYSPSYSVDKAIDRGLDQQKAIVSLKGINRRKKAGANHLIPRRLRELRGHACAAGMCRYLRVFVHCIKLPTMCSCGRRDTTWCSR